LGKLTRIGSNLSEAKRSYDTNRAVGQIETCAFNDVRTEVLILNYPGFDVFSGFHDRNAKWIEAVDGLANACEKMQQLAKEEPGPYFVFSQSTHTVVASIDSSPKAKHASAGGNAARDVA
jgi:hypothetical protein